MKKMLPAWITIAAGLFVVAILLLMGPPDIGLNEKRCEIAEKASKDAVNGVVTRKFLDKDSHMMETVEYVSILRKISESTIFAGDNSGAFQYLAPGDSIMKGSNSFELIVSREGQRRVFKLDYGCEKNKE